MYDELVLLFEAHRKRAAIPCDETCFCWSVERLIVCHERPAVEHRVQADGAYCECNGITFAHTGACPKCNRPYPPRR